MAKQRHRSGARRRRRSPPAEKTPAPRRSTRRTVHLDRRRARRGRRRRARHHQGHERRSPRPGKSSFQPVDADGHRAIDDVPASVFNTVGVTSPVASVTPPQAVEGPAGADRRPARAAQKLPEVLYLGAEYCPYCAAQRWTTIIALSRFGTWSGLGQHVELLPTTSTRTPRPSPS